MTIRLPRVLEDRLRVLAAQANMGRDSDAIKRYVVEILELWLLEHRSNRYQVPAEDYTAQRDMNPFEQGG